MAIRYGTVQYSTVYVSTMLRRHRGLIFCRQHIHNVQHLIIVIIPRPTFLRSDDLKRAGNTMSTSTRRTWRSLLVVVAGTTALFTFLYHPYTGTDEVVGYSSWLSSSSSPACDTSSTTCEPDHPGKTRADRSLFPGHMLQPLDVPTDYYQYNSVALLDLHSCLATKSCGKNQDKVVILDSNWFRQGIAEGWKGGEGQSQWGLGVGDVQWGEGVLLIKTSAFGALGCGLRCLGSIYREPTPSSCSSGSKTSLTDSPLSPLPPPKYKFLAHMTTKTTPRNKSIVQLTRKPRVYMPDHRQRG